MSDYKFTFCEDIIEVYVRISGNPKEIIVQVHSEKHGFLLNEVAPVSGYSYLLGAPDSELEAFALRQVAIKFYEQEK